MLKIAQKLKYFLEDFNTNIKSYDSVSLFNCKNLKLSSLIKHFQNKKTHNLYVNNQQFNKINNFRSLFNNNCQFNFSKIKKPLQKLILSKKLINKQENGYVIYKSTQHTSFKIVSLIFLFAMALSVVAIYLTQQQYNTDQYVILGLLALSFILYQRRIMKTLKKIVIQPKGLQIYIHSHSFMGIESQNQIIRWLNSKVAVIPIELMNGIGKGTSIGGNIINVGGKYDYNQLKYWFSQKYILDRAAFQQVVNGKHVIFKEEYKMI